MGGINIRAAALLAFGAAAMGAGAIFRDLPLLPVESRGGGSAGSRRGRGKHKPRRHGQKLKSCRNKISRRVKRRHRRAQ